MSPIRTEIAVGTIFKSWQVVCEIDKKNNARYFLATCLDCNNDFEIRLSSLVDENKNFCCNECAQKRKQRNINPGDVFNCWRVINEIDSRKSNRVFLCECLLCNNEYPVQLGNLVSENHHICCFTCARYNKRLNINIGDIFKGWQVIDFAESRDYTRYFKCECIGCGYIRDISISVLNNKEECFVCHYCAHVGENSHFWKGGITAKDKADRAYIGSTINPIIRKRDNYICQNCSKRGKLNVHHVYDFLSYPELRFEESNLITLCEDCHIRDFHKLYYRGNQNTLADLETWMGKEYKYRDELLEKYNEYYTESES